MKTFGWYIAHDGRKLWAATKAEARKLAQAIANDTGRGVTVRPAKTTAARPKAKTTAAPSRMKRNPDPGSFIHLLEQQTKGRMAREAYMAKTKATRLAKGMRRRGTSTSQAEAGARKSGKFVVTAANRKERLVLYRPSRPAADRLADQFTAAGYDVHVREA